jgi:hypothetical protein
VLLTTRLTHPLAVPLYVSFVFGVGAEMQTEGRKDRQSCMTRGVVYGQVLTRLRLRSHVAECAPDTVEDNRPVVLKMMT